MVLCDAQCNAIFYIHRAAMKKITKKSSRNKKQIYFKVTFYSIYFIDICLFCRYLSGFFIRRSQWMHILGPKTTSRLSNTHNVDSHKYCLLRKKYDKKKRPRENEQNKKEINVQENSLWVYFRCLLEIDPNLKLTLFLLVELVVYGSSTTSKK